MGIYQWFVLGVVLGLLIGWTGGLVVINRIRDEAEKGKLEFEMHPAMRRFNQAFEKARRLE